MAHEELPVPIYSSLEPVYGEGSPLEEAQLRFQTLKAKFVEFFGKEPEVYARSPGKILDPDSLSLELFLIGNRWWDWSVLMDFLVLVCREGESDRGAHRLRRVLGAADGDKAGHDRGDQEARCRRVAEGAPDWECQWKVFHVYLPCGS